jgi:hypothetical protein
MTQGDVMAQGPGPAESKWGLPAPHPWAAGQVLAHFQKQFPPHVKVSQ